MAELNWIDKKERLPTKEDADGNGYIYALSHGAIVNCIHLGHFATCMTSFTHWLPFREMPVPKRWRVPTIHDLAKAGKPIPCRVRNKDGECWFGSELSAIDLNPLCCCKFKTLYGNSWWLFCEICDE